MPLPFRIRSLVLLLSAAAASSPAWSLGMPAVPADAATLQQVQQVQQL